MREGLNDADVGGLKGKIAAAVRVESMMSARTFTSSASFILHKFITVMCPAGFLNAPVQQWSRRSLSALFVEWQLDMLLDDSKAFTGKTLFQNFRHK